jgi:hypothetical protein
MTAIIDTHPDGGFIATVDGNQVGPRADTLGEAIATACYMLRGPLTLTPAARAHTPHYGKTGPEAAELLARHLVKIEAEQGAVTYAHLYSRGWPPADIDRLIDLARLRAEQLKSVRSSDNTGRAA